MPTPTIPDGELFFNATLWTGNGTTQTITNGVAGQNFQPDLVWNKSRSNADFHNVFDSVRGGIARLVTNNTNAESSTGNGFAGITSTGFNLDGSGGGGDNNVSGRTYVGWQWKAGGAAVTNTAGSITSQVSANTTSGFSIVTYTGTGANATVGHGLGVAPSFIIVKRRNTTGGWPVYTGVFGKDSALELQSTAAVQTISDFWNTANPTSSVFGVNGSYTSINASGGTYVAYCWAPIAGYSAFGSYTGNGSADGPFVYLGFRPRFVMWKRSDSTGDWIIFDSSRNTYNYADLQLCPNTSGAEQVTGGGFVRMDFLSNGFKIRSTDSYINASGGTYIYACFAENPFKYSNAR